LVFLYPSLTVVVELLDPSWREQRAKADARYAMTNLSTADVANNLKRLASQRTDVFDPISGRPVSEEEQARLKKPATTFGSDDTAARAAGGQNLTIDEQIKSIRERFGQ
jgi:splicing factor 3A subunit 1